MATDPSEASADTVVIGEPMPNAGYSNQTDIVVPTGSPTGSELSQWVWNAYANPLPERLSRKRVWGNKKRQVVEDEFDWPEKEGSNKNKTAYTFLRNDVPTSKGTINEELEAGSVSVLNIIRDKGGLGKPKIIAVGQKRTPISRFTFEFPGGKVNDEDESILHSAVRENHEETGLPDVFDISNDSEKDRWRLVNSRVPKATYNSNSGIGGSGSKLAILEWETDGSINTDRDLPALTKLSPGEKARRLKRFVYPVSELSSVLNECTDLQITPDIVFSLVEPMMELTTELVSDRSEPMPTSVGSTLVEAAA